MRTYKNKIAGSNGDPTGEEFQKVNEAEGTGSTGKPQGKGGRRHGKKDGIKGKPHNDFNWYNRYPELTRDVGTIIYSQPNGYIVRGFNELPTQYATPGIMTLAVVNCPGVSEDQTSPVNVAVTKIYTAIRKLNANNIPYDPADVGMYLYAVMDIHKMIAHMIRLYGLVNKFDATNIYWPRAVVESLGADYDSLVYNRAALRELINNMINAINARCIPKDYTILSRYIWMMGNTFIDSANTKGQLYAYKPAGYYVYEPYTDTRGGKLTWTDLSAKLTFEELREVCYTQLNAVMFDNDIRMISGDISKTFTESELMRWNMIGPDLNASIVYNTGILSQIENATIAPPQFYETALNEGDSLNVVQENGYLVYHPRAVLPESELFNSTTVLNNQHVAAPTIENVIVSTRLTTTFNRDEAGAPVYLQDCGSEWIAYANYVDSLSGGDVFTYWSMNDMTPEKARDLAALATFDWAPIRVAHYGTTILSGFFGDLDNWITLDREVLSRMHRVCLWSEFANPSAGVLK